MARRFKKVRLSKTLKPDIKYTLKYAVENSPKTMIGYEPPWGSKENPVIGCLAPKGMVWKVER